MSSMRGIRVSEFGGPNVLKYVTDLPRPAKPTGKQKGDRVYFGRNIGGCYSEFTLTTESQTFALHDNLTFQQGAALAVSYSTAYGAMVKKANLKSGEAILVHGASGAVGLACCQLARLLGATVVGTAGTEQGMKLILSNGAHLAFNHREEGYIDKIKTAVKGFDVIIEMLANFNLEKDLELTKIGTRIAIVGSHGKIELTPRAVMTNEVSIIGVTLLNSTEKDWVEFGAFFRAGQENGWLRPVVGQEFSLDQAEQSHVEVIEHKNGSHGKVVLNV